MVRDGLLVTIAVAKLLDDASENGWPTARSHKFWCTGDWENEVEKERGNKGDLRWVTGGWLEAVWRNPANLEFAPRN